MAKKFGKFLLFTAALGSAAAATYYYLQKKDSTDVAPEDDDYDDFSEDLDGEDSGRKYVPLTPEPKKEEEPGKEAAPEKEAEPGEEAEPKASESSFTPLSETVASVEQGAAVVEETVEEFFDEDDPE